ncbi:LacI family DNA-binding transcriptional regulator [Burkholderia sp. 3C]
MKDVALAAGVSQPAVSYAYNKPSEISDAQREHILSVAKALGYPGPNVRGRSLRSGRVGAIGLMIMDELPYAFTDPSTVALLRGIAEINEQSNVALSLFPLQKSETDDPARGMSLAVRGFVDGLIVHSLPDQYPGIDVAIQQGIPLVIVDAPVIDGLPFVGIDDFSAGATQMQHLIDLGHRRIGIAADRLRPDGIRGSVTARRLSRSTERVVSARLKGYLSVLEAAGLGFNDVPIVEAGGFDEASSAWAAEQLLATPGLTAIATTSDIMALAILKAAKANGIAVPAALSVIGFDDIPEAAAAGLTTIRQPLIDKGREAARILDALLAAPPGKATIERTIFPTECVVRTSTAAIATGSRSPRRS